MGKQTQEFDLMIASIAKENNLIVITRNKKHFEDIPDLKVEEW
jgi:predicted nucleic acid-binding protein